jgi:hypothetical protein
MPSFLDQAATILLFSLGLSVALYVLVRGQAWALRVDSAEVKRRHLRIALGMFVFGLVGLTLAFLAGDLGWVAPR